MFFFSNSREAAQRESSYWKVSSQTQNPSVFPLRQPQHMLLSSWPQDDCCPQALVIASKLQTGKIRGDKRQRTKGNSPGDFHLYLMGQSCVTYYCSCKRGEETEFWLFSLYTRRRQGRRSCEQLFGSSSVVSITSIKTIFFTPLSSKFEIILGLSRERE